MQTAFYILFIQFNAIFLNSEQKSHLVHGKQPLLKPSPPPPSPLRNGHWPFCVTKVGMDAVPYNTRDSLLMWELFMNTKF